MECRYSRCDDGFYRSRPARPGSAFCSDTCKNAYHKYSDHSHPIPNSVNCYICKEFERNEIEKYQRAHHQLPRADAHHVSIPQQVPYTGAELPYAGARPRDNDRGFAFELVNQKKLCAISGCPLIATPGHNYCSRDHAFLDQVKICSIPRCNSYVCPGSNYCTEHAAQRH